MSAHSVQDHYAGDDTGSSMASRILAAVRAVYGSDVAITPETLAPLDHFNARGLAATQELVALLEPQAGESLLDIGSGIGGPARWIAMQYGCTVTGVDVTAPFCEAARALNAACGITNQVRIVDGTALALPFPDASFDRAYSHGVLMSIADKVGVYREACRVLKPGGRLVVFQRHAGPNGPPEFPVSWATRPGGEFSRDRCGHPPRPDGGGLCRGVVARCDPGGVRRANRLAPQDRGGGAAAARHAGVDR